MDTGRQKSPTTTYLEINPHLNGKIYEEIVPWLQRQYDLCAYVFMLWRQGDVVIFIFTLNADTSLSDPIQKTREVCIQVVGLPGEKIVQFPKEKRVTLNNSPKIIWVPSSGQKELKHLIDASPIPDTGVYKNTSPVYILEFVMGP